MEQEEKLSPQQSLALIAGVISQTRENIKQHSFIFLLWGWLLAIASLVWFVLQTQTTCKYYFLPFPILSATGLIASFFYYQKNISVHSETYLNYFIKILWVVLSIGFIAIVFVSVYEHIKPFSYTLILASVGTMVTGLTMKFKPLFYGGILFLLASLFCLLLPSEYKVLVHGIAIIFGYIIPGYMLRNLKSVN